MPFVLDAFIALCWAFTDEDHTQADVAMELMATDEAVVPSLLWFEVRNSLIMNERRNRLGGSLLVRAARVEGVHLLEES